VSTIYEGTIAHPEFTDEPVRRREERDEMSPRTRPGA